MEYKKILCIIFLTLSIKLSFASDYRSIKEVTSKANLRAGPGRWYPIKLSLIHI